MLGTVGHLIQAVQQRGGGVALPGLDDPDGIFVGIQHGGQNLPGNVAGVHAAGVAALMEGVGGVVVGGVAVDLLLALVEQCCVLVKGFIGGAQHGGPLEGAPGALGDDIGAGQGIFAGGPGGDVRGNHAGVALKHRLHPQIAHDLLILSCQLGALLEPGVVDRAAEAGEVGHVGPGVVGGAGDVVLGLLVGVAQLTQEPAPDLLLGGGIQNHIDTVQRQPVQLVAPFLLAPEGHGVGQGAVVVGVANPGLGLLMDGAIDDRRGSRQVHLIAHLGDVGIAVVLQIMVDAGGQGNAVVALDVYLAVLGGQFEVVVAVGGFGQLQGEPGLVVLAQTAGDDAVDLGVGILCGHGGVGIFGLVKVHHSDGRQLLNFGAAGGAQNANLIQHCCGLGGVVLQVDADIAGFHAGCIEALAVVQSGGVPGGLFRQLGEVPAVQAGVDGVLGVAVLGGVDLDGIQVVICTQIDVRVGGIVAAPPDGVLAAVGDVLGQGLAGGGVHRLAVGDTAILNRDLTAVDLKLRHGGPADAVAHIVGAGMHDDPDLGVGLFQEGILLGAVIGAVGGGMIHKGIVVAVTVPGQNAVSKGVVVGLGVHVLEGDGHGIHASCLLVGQDDGLLGSQLGIVELVQGGGVAVHQIGGALGGMLHAAGGGDGGLGGDVVVGRELHFLLLVDLDLADTGPELADRIALLRIGQGHIEVGGGDSLGDGEPGGHVAGEGDGLAAEGDQVTGDAVLGVLHGDGDRAGSHVVAAQLHHHLRDGAAHVQLHHGGGGPDTLGLPVGGYVTVNDIADDIGGIRAVGGAGGAQQGHIHQLLGGQRRRRRQQPRDDAQGHNAAEHPLFPILHA